MESYKTGKNKVYEHIKKELEWRARRGHSTSERRGLFVDPSRNAAVVIGLAPELTTQLIYRKIRKELFSLKFAESFRGYYYCCW